MAIDYNRKAPDNNGDTKAVYVVDSIMKDYTYLKSIIEFRNNADDNPIEAIRNRRNLNDNTLPSESLYRFGIDLSDALMVGILNVSTNAQLRIVNDVESNKVLCNITVNGLGNGGGECGYTLRNIPMHRNIESEFQFSKDRSHLNHVLSSFFTSNKVFMLESVELFKHVDVRHNKQSTRVSG